MWYSEKTGLKEIGKGVVPELWNEFSDAWYNDLDVLVDSPTSEAAIQAANAYLTYYGAGTKIVDVGWDEANRCFTWDIEKIKVV